MTVTYARRRGGALRPTRCEPGRVAPSFELLLSSLADVDLFSDEGSSSPPIEYVRARSVIGAEPVNPHGEIGSARPKPKRRRRSKRSTSNRGSVVTGPWDAKGGPTPMEQAELDVLLDRISDGGIDSLTKAERARLNALSKRMRGS